jgi:hypothetical protein
LPQGRKIVVPYGSVIDRVGQFLDIVSHRLIVDSCRRERVDLIA